MSLTCDCEFGDGPEVFRQKTVKASKEHKCCECYRTIKKGEYYDYVFGVWEGDAMTFKTCEQCDDLRASLEELGFCIDFENLKEAHQEYISEYVTSP
jgi:hypothetical protein